MGAVSSNPAPSCCHASAAVISDSTPGPEWISAAVTSGGSDMKSMTVTLSDLGNALETPDDYGTNNPGTLKIGASGVDQQTAIWDRTSWRLSSFASGSDPDMSSVQRRCSSQPLFCGRRAGGQDSPV